jgi:hypothetical protein
MAIGRGMTKTNHYCWRTVQLPEDEEARSVIVGNWYGCLRISPGVIEKGFFVHKKDSKGSLSERRCWVLF